MNLPFCRWRMLFAIFFLDTRTLPVFHGHIVNGRGYSPRRKPPPDNRPAARQTSLWVISKEAAHARRRGTDPEIGGTPLGLWLDGQVPGARRSKSLPQYQHWPGWTDFWSIVMLAAPRPR